MNELEKAANEHAGQTLSCCIYPDDYSIGKKGEITDYETRKESFIAGAEWNAKQSPWIKTAEQLPAPIIEIVDGEEYGSVFVIGRTSERETPDLHSYYGYNGDYRWEDGRVPEYWCPIPELPKK